MSLAQVFWMKDAQGQPARFFLGAEREAVQELLETLTDSVADVRKRFRTFVNSDKADERIVFVEERGQIRPARPEERADTNALAIPA